VIYSYVLTAVGIGALYFAGSARTRQGAWVLGMISQLMWAAYALETEQHGFIVSACLYGGMYARNWVKGLRGL